MKARNNSTLLRHGMLAYIVLTASTCYVLILQGLHSAPPFAFAGLRTLLGGAAILGFSALVRQRTIPEKRLWKWIPLVSLTATTLTFGSMFLSPSFAGAGLASILGNAQPVFIAIIGYLLLNERLSCFQSAFFLLGLLGVVVIVSTSVDDGFDGVSVGATIALITSLSAAIGSVLVRLIHLRDSLLSFTAWQLMAGGSLLVVISLATGEPAVNWSRPFAVILLILGIFNSAIVTCFWFFLLQRESAGKLSIYLFLIPVLGVVWAMVFYGERPGATSLIGGAMVLISVFSQEFEGFVRKMRLKGKGVRTN